jgi:4-carboxymuconolactone decarboxylase
MISEMTQRGLDFFKETNGEAAAKQMELGLSSTAFGSPMAQLACDFAFGSVWTREGLERKQRSLVILGVLIAQRQTGELKNHVRMGIANGLTVREIEEALIQALPYVGFPAAASAQSAMIEVLRELGLDNGSKTAEERGML